MIDGLKLTISGEEIRDLLAARIRTHEERAARLTEELTKSPVEERSRRERFRALVRTNRPEWHEWRATMLRFIREHVQPTEYYALDEGDVAFAELVADEPDLPLAVGDCGEGCADWFEEMARSSEEGAAER